PARANLLVARGGGRNGRRARFRSVCPKGREGSNPSSPTSRRTLLVDLRSTSLATAVLTRGDDPPDPPRGPLFCCGWAPLARFSPLVGGSRRSWWFWPLARSRRSWWFWPLAVR